MGPGRGAVLGELGVFSREVLERPLYGYQLEAARAILESVRRREGHEFLLVMARQSGKNETVSQLLVYLLNVLQRSGGNMVYAAIGEGLWRGMRRLEMHLDNAWNKNVWRREGRPTRRSLGEASVVFLSSHRQAFARGETAQHLLVIDELQDQDAAHLQAVFQPMRATTNATAVYLGTVRTTYDALWLKKEELERLQEQDGVRRVFMVGPEAVCAENAHYEAFLAGEIAKHGRKHPLIKSEYFLEPLDNESGLFPERRVKLMRGGHGRSEFGMRTAELTHPPAPSQIGRGREARVVDREVFVATLDVAGIDEGTHPPAPSQVGRGRLRDRGRDYTTCTIFRVASGKGQVASGPVYEAVDVFVDQGSQHFREHGDGRPSLARQLLAYLEHWEVSTLVGDATGVGEGLLNWLGAAMGSERVYPFKFTRRSKAQLGVDFLALVETNRFKYFDVEQAYDDAWWFFEQARRCVFELEAGRPMETHMRWFVPETTKVSTPQGRVALHDDRLVSAALIAEADKLVRERKVFVGRAESVVIRGIDPIEELSGW